jgi:hypothetical protein
MAHSTNIPLQSLTCSAQPLVLFLLDKTLAHTATASTQSKLGVLIEAMSVYQYLYDNTDLVLATAHRISIQARAMVRDRSITGWEDILSQDPKAYIRFIVTMEIALSKGAFPQESDLPFTSITPASRDEAEGKAAHPTPHSPANNRRDEMVQHSCISKICPRASSPCLPPPKSQSEGIIMPATVEADAEVAEFMDGGAVSKPGNELGSIEPFLMDPDTLLHNILESYITEGNLNAELVGLPWEWDSVS